MIRNILREQNVKASFFLTGNFYRNRAFRSTIRKLKNDGHYLGAHSDRHLLYCDWSDRDSLLVTKEAFSADLMANYREMEKFGVTPDAAAYFLPPYEWYNDSIAAWTRELGFTLINFSPGTISHADYTTPDMKNYRSSDTIYRSIIDYEKDEGMNGFILLTHIGTDPARTDKFYHRLVALIDVLRLKGYGFRRIDELLRE